MSQLQAIWTAWGALIRKVLTLLAAFGSMWKLLLTFVPSPSTLPWWGVALLVLSALLFLLVVVWEFLDHRGVHVYAKRDTEGIKQYMHKWIRHGGRVAVWTRDMTWAENANTRLLLTKKARAGELILCLPTMNELANELQDAGAEVCAYGVELLESPASRFTIVDFGKDGSRVAVGRTDGSTHVIHEFGVGRHPAFHLAEDLVSIARSINEKRVSNDRR